MSLRYNNTPSFLSSFQTRIKIVRTLVFIAFSFLGVRLVYVQAFLGPMLTQKADRQISPRNAVKNSRYKILDRNGLVLAEMGQVQSCFVDPTMIESKTKTAKELSRISGLSEKNILSLLTKTKGSFVWIKRNMPSDQVEKIIALKMKGVAFKQEYRRNYPQGLLAGHLLGLVGIDGEGLSGLEYQFNKQLKSSTQNGGGDMVLTLDSFIQTIAERELAWGAKRANAKSGMVLVQSPVSGEILAMASWPPIELNADNPPSMKDLRIHPLVDNFEPGSTFKIVIGAASLEEKLVKKGEVFSGENGKWKVMDITLHDHEAKKDMLFEDIFIHSSNIGTAKLAERLGRDRFYQYARLFGFGVFPGSGLTCESKGVLRVPTQWSGVSKYVVSFGQEVGVNAVQLIGAFSTIANGGNLMEPHLIRYIRTEKGDRIDQRNPSVVRRVISPETASNLNNILIKVVENGTGVNAAIQWDSSTKVAGKTGTSQKFDFKNNRYHDLLSLISFCGYFPANDPKYTILVVLDEPEGRSWGGLDAAPVFRRIAEQISPTMMVAKAEK